MWKAVKQNALSLTIMMVLVAICFYFAGDVKEVRYDCTMAEFHPDYPPKVKEACRRLKHEANK